MKLPASDNNCIVHTTCGSVHEYLGKLDRYTDNEVSKLAAAAADSSCAAVFAAPMQEIRRSFLERNGYRDGSVGVAVAQLMACYRLVALLKLAEERGWVDTDERQLLRSAREGLLVGFWHVLKGFERTPGSCSLRLAHGLLRRAVALVLRFQLY